MNKVHSIKTSTEDCILFITISFAEIVIVKNVVKTVNANHDPDPGKLDPNCALDHTKKFNQLFLEP